MDQIPETLPYIFDLKWFPENFLTVTEVPSEIIQKLKIGYESIEIKSHFAKNQPFTFTNITEYTNTSLEASLLDNMDTIVHSRSIDSNFEWNHRKWL